MKIITFGTFDLLHIGHINILKRAKEYGSYLIVGISSDNFNFTKKNKYPIYNEKDRMEIIKSLKFVDEVFLEESMELKQEYIDHYKAEILIMGDDWKNRFDDLNCYVIYLPRTDEISTTNTIKNITNRFLLQQKD